MKNKIRSPFNAVYEKKGFKRGRAMEYSTEKPLQKALTREKLLVGGGGWGERRLNSTRHYFVSLYLLTNDYGG